MVPRTSVCGWSGVYCCVTVVIAPAVLAIWNARTAPGGRAAARRTLCRVLFWFIGTALVAVWIVFRDPRFDYRLLVVGSVLPAPVDAVLGAFFGGARVLHSLAFSVGLLAVLMLATAGRRPIRKTLLALPVGTLLHLVFTGAWTNTRVFWWPAGGFGFGDAVHPVAARGWWNVPLELAGVALCWWVVRRASLTDAAARDRFRRTGQLALPVQ